MINANLLINHVAAEAKEPQVLVLCMKNEIDEFEPVKVKGEFLFADLGGALQHMFRSDFQGKGFRFVNAKNFFDVVHMEIKC